MACHLNRFSTIVDFKTVCSYLGLSVNLPVESIAASLEPKELEQDLDGWNNNWEWGMDGMASAPQHQPLNGTWPSSHCLVSMSSFADTMVVAHGQHAHFLTSKWGEENEEEKLKFSISSSKRLTSDPSEMVTSVLCIPLSSQRRSQPTGPDWTCIAIGFSSGFLRVYTQEGELLISQCLREGPVKRLLYQNTHSEGSLGDLVAICGDSRIITLDAFSFHQTVKACRSHLARAKAGQSPMLQPPTLVFKKWILQDVVELSDCCLLVSMANPVFDTLVWDCIRGGPGSYHKMLAPSTNILLSAGLNFFLGAFHFTEAGGQINLSDVMGAVTSKIKTALLPQAMVGKFNLWGKSSSTEELPVEPATSVSMRFGFYDKRRKGLSLLLSPNGRLVVLTDSFGRVILYDVPRGMCSRMWKGYRDAQCGWVECEEEESKKSKGTPRKAVFLIIYAPRRGILEVWSVPEVLRIAAFTVSKSALLLCPGYCIMGANVKDFPRSLLYSCCLLEPDGNIATVQIPFSTALKKTRSCPQKDVYILTDLQQLLKEKKDNFDQEIKNLFQNIHSVAVLLKALNLILSEDHLSNQCLQEYLTSFLEQRASVHSSSEGEDQLVLTGKRLLDLLIIFSQISELDRLPVQTVAVKSQSPDAKALSESLKFTSEEEVKQLMTVISKHEKCLAASFSMARSKRAKHVSFSESEPRLTHREFLKGFDWTANHDTSSVPLKSDVSSDWKQTIGSVIFENAIEDENKIISLRTIIDSSPLKSCDLLDLLLHCWLSRKDPYYWQHWLNLSTLLQMITSREPLDCKDMFRLLSASTNPPCTYVACVLLRSLICETADIATTSQQPKVENGEWETLTEEHVRWNLLQKRLEDLVVLDSLLRSRGHEYSSTISVQLLLSKGPGAVSEIIAEWIVKSSLDVHRLYELVDTETETETSTDSDEHNSLLKEIWDEVLERFPRSLERDSMLANCSWEQMVVWSKDPDDVSHLKSTLDTLAPITSAILKNGVACMMWKTFVVNRFEALSLLVEKVGKAPKERLCKQDLSMSAIYLEPFLEFCSQLLEIIIEANVVSDVESLPQIPPDDMWRETSPAPLPLGDCSSSITSSSTGLPLVALAYNQLPSNYVLLYNHKLLALALILIITFNLKNTRPLSFYDLKGRQAFFHELQGSYPAPQSSLPFKVVMGRTNFLQRVASAIAHSLPDSLPPSQSSSSFQDTDESSSMEERRSREREASRWMNRTLELAKGWDVSLDEIRRHYVCQLYYCGQDTLAEECLSSVSDYLSLGSQLLLLAGQRVASVLLGPGQDEAARLAYLPPALSKWLKALDLSELRSPAASLSATKELISHAINLTSEDSPENKRALALLDAIVTEKVVFPS